MGGVQGDKQVGTDRKPGASAPGARQAMNTLQELQFSREFRAAMREFFPRLLLALLAQTRYILELSPEREAMPNPLR